MADKCILDPNVDCRGLIRAGELAKDIQAVEKDVEELRERNDRNHKEYFDRLALLEAHNKVQDAHYEHIIEKLTDITNKLSSLSARIASIETKPGKRWDSMVEKGLGIVLAAVLGYILAHAGL